MSPTYFRPIILICLRQNVMAIVLALAMPFNHIFRLSCVQCGEIKFSGHASEKLREHQVLFFNSLLMCFLASNMQVRSRILRLLAYNN
jgi:hypothetical protein